MQNLVRLAMIGGVVFAAACSNGPRKGFDTIGAGAAPGASGGAPPPPGVASASAPAPAATTSDTSKKVAPATKGGTAKKP
jgi:hypothetical protein